MGIYYLGAFPPPYGGVTVKNELLYNALLENGIEGLKRIDTGRAKRNLFLLLRTVSMLFLNRTHTMFIAVAGGQRRNVSLILNRFNKAGLRRAILIVMGGSLASVMRGDEKYIRSLAQYKIIYVETEGMLRELNSLGIHNVSIYPNCRARPKVDFRGRRNDAAPLRCVFFSLITFEKGIDLVADTARMLGDTEFHIYGEIKEEGKEIFYKYLSDYPNLEYHGVFKGKEDEVYEELARYDVMLLPTRWKHEGVPGTLVEAKIAGIPAIVSDICYNAEIIEDGASGIVLKENTTEALAAAIRYLDKNREELYRLKCGAKQSAEMYYFENYIDDVIRQLED